MGAISDRIQKASAVRAIASQSDDEALQKAADDRAEAYGLAMAVAKSFHDGEVPQGLHEDIVEDPTWYLEGAGVDVAAELGDADDESLLPDDVSKSEDVEKSYVGFAKLVAKFMSEGVPREKAEARAASIGREKYGSRFQGAAEAGRKLG